MGSIKSVTLMLLNIVHLMFGLLLIAASIWFFMEIRNITNLMDPDHNRMRSISWPEVIPWIFMLVGLLVLFISCCGCTGAKAKTRGLLQMYVVFEILVVLSSIAAVAVTLLFADSKVDAFVKITIHDGFTYMQWNPNPQLKISFGEMEKRFHCCGASHPAQYRNMLSFPESCCDTSLPNYKGVCDLENETANNRHGCIDIAKYYSHKIITGLCAGGALIGVIGLLNIVITIFLLSSKKKQDTDKMNTKYNEAGTLKC